MTVDMEQYKVEPDFEKRFVCAVRDGIHICIKEPRCCYTHTQRERVHMLL